MGHYGLAKGNNLTDRLSFMTLTLLLLSLQSQRENMKSSIIIYGK